MKYFRPDTTNASPSRRTVVAMLVGSDEATSGSATVNADRMSPASSGSSQRARWASVA